MLLPNACQLTVHCERNADNSDRASTSHPRADPAAALSFRSEGHICAQVINLRTLKPIDRDTIVKSIKKTHRVVSAEEGWPQCGIGAELIAIATEECFDDLDAPPERVTGAEVPMPYAANLEAAALPQVNSIASLLLIAQGKPGRHRCWYGMGRKCRRQSCA